MTQTRRHGAAGIGTLVAALVLVLLASCQRSVSAATIQPPTRGEGKAGRITFVELGSVNCIPCKAMQPLMEKVRKEYPEQVEVIFHDVWTEEGKPQARAFKIRVIPTQVFLDKGGREYFRHEGYLPWEEILAALERGGLKR